MRHILRATAISAAILCATTSTLLAQDHGKPSQHDHSHAHGHDHSHAAEQIYKGYFEDAQIAERPLADWAGVWQSVYPYLQDGTLASVMESKARKGDKTAAEYTAEYETGYKTDTNRIEISPDGVVTFRQADGTRQSGTYASDGYEVLTYAKGNRGVRFIFRKTSGDDSAPEFIQFSDHRIAPSKSDHYHLYWGNDRAALLNEVTHWPTYYPAGMSGQEITAEMLVH